MSRPRYGFYWYSSDRQKVVYRSDRVIPALDRFTLVTRLSPDDAELRAVYSSDRKMIEKQLSATRKLLPTTPQSSRSSGRKDSEGPRASIFDFGLSTLDLLS